MNKYVIPGNTSSFCDPTLCVLHSLLFYILFTTAFLPNQMILDSLDHDISLKTFLPHFRTQVLGLIRVSYCGKASDKPSPNWGFLVDDLGSCKSTPGDYNWSCVVDLAYFPLGNPLPEFIGNTTE